MSKRVKTLIFWIIWITIVGLLNLYVYLTVPNSISQLGLSIICLIVVIWGLIDLLLTIRSNQKLK